MVTSCQLHGVNSPVARGDTALQQFMCYREKCRHRSPSVLNNTVMKLSAVRLNDKQR